MRSAGADRSILDAQANHFDALNLLGFIAAQTERTEDAESLLRRAVAAQPGNATAHSHYGNILQERRQFDAAVASYDKAIALKPDHVEAYCHCGNVLRELMRLRESEACYLKALELDPDHGLARWALAFMAIPPLVQENKDPQAARAAFARALEDLDAWFVPSRMDQAYKAVGSSQPFYLAYQELDNKGLLSAYGAICGRLMAHWQQANGFKPNQFSPSGKIKLGIVSDQIRKHSVWNAIVKGWILNLDLNRFELHVFSLSDVADEETSLAQARAASFTQGKRSLAEWVRAILEIDIEVLIFPEIGMHALTTQLANLRLAPLQLATWGHPETTGFPTGDCYLSGELFEGGNAKDAYTESLVCLPHLGCNYARICPN